MPGGYGPDFRRYAFEQGDIGSPDGCPGELQQYEIEVVIDVDTDRGLLCHMVTGCGLEHAHEPMDRLLVRPGRGFAAHRVAVDHFDQTAEICGQLPPDLDGDRFWLDIVRPCPIEDG